jgi:hypothetical protein
MIANWTSCTHFHTSTNQIASQGMVVVSKSPEEMLKFVWTSQFPNILPQAVHTIIAPSLLPINTSISQQISSGHFIGTFDTE